MKNNSMTKQEIQRWEITQRSYFKRERLLHWQFILLKNNGFDFNSQIGLWLSFDEARTYIHSLNLKGSKEYKQWWKKHKPNNIPYNPYRVYNDKWISWGDWLGTGRIATNKIVYLPFKEAREYVHSLGLKSSNEWQEYCISGKKPTNIPSNPQITYKNEWKGMGDWTGTNYTVGGIKKSIMPFNDARTFVRSLGLKDSREWNKWFQKNNPTDIPCHPEISYKNEWISWNNWLGTEWISFDEVKKLVHPLKLKNIQEWFKWWVLNKPLNVPRHVEITYKDEWKGTKDFLGN